MTLGYTLSLTQKIAKEPPRGRLSLYTVFTPDLLSNPLVPDATFYICSGYTVNEQTIVLNKLDIF